MLTGEIRTHQTQGRFMQRRRAALGARQRDRAQRRRRLARPSSSCSSRTSPSRPAASSCSPPATTSRACSPRPRPSSRPRRCCWRRSAPTSAGRSARCGSSTRRSGELQPAASWRHRSFRARCPPTPRPLAADDLPMRVTRSGEPVWTEALMAGAASARASAIAAAGLSGAVCLPIVTSEGCLGATGVLLPRARRARRAAARAARHDRHADRPLHPAPPRRRRARRRPRRGARGGAS